MGTIINYMKFVGMIYIDTSTNDDRDNINDNYCPLVEKTMLTKLFGETLYNDFNSNKTVSKYATLINGDSTKYDYNGYTKLFTGIKDMLAYFTYCEYITDQMNGFNTQLGQSKAKAQNSELVFPSSKICKVWNMGVDLYYATIDYINYKNSLIADTYADFLPEDIDKINSFGL